MPSLHRAQWRVGAGESASYVAPWQLDIWLTALRTALQRRSKQCCGGATSRLQPTIHGTWANEKLPRAHAS